MCAYACTLFTIARRKSSYFLPTGDDEKCAEWRTKEAQRPPAEVCPLVGFKCSTCLAHVDYPAAISYLHEEEKRNEIMHNQRAGGG